MPNPVITNNDVGHVELSDGTFRDDVLTAAGAATFKAGTILARDSATLKLVPFVVGGSTNENGIPKAVLTYEVVATGAGDIPVRPLVRGDVRQERLVVHATGDASTITTAHREVLRDYGILALPSKQLAGLDNQ